MNTNFSIIPTLELNQACEFVERKGIGHPDTLSDQLGEELSIAYSKYCLENFGVILHHNFDKVGLMGGMSDVGFGIGRITSPIRVLVNGRASSQFGGRTIPLHDIVADVVSRFFSRNFAHIVDAEKIYRIMWEIASGSSPGAIAAEEGFRHHWFAPRDASDLSELTSLNCNDTSMGCAFYGYTDVERFVLAVEKKLNSRDFKLEKPWIGNDIKLMCCRHKDKIELTLCVPQIGVYVSNYDEYVSHKEVIRNEILSVARELIPQYKLSINLNMRDRFNDMNKDLYLTYTGSSVEMGDEGFVGRGNRFGGVISPNRMYSMEGIAGKNPVYHTGKMYSVLAYEIARRVWEKYRIRSEVSVVGMTGASLKIPHSVMIKADGGLIQPDDVAQIIKEIDFAKLTDNILNSNYQLF